MFLDRASLLGQRAKTTATWSGCVLAMRSAWASSPEWRGTVSKSSRHDRAALGERVGGPRSQRAQRLYEALEQVAAECTAPGARPGQPRRFAMLSELFATFTETGQLRTGAPARSALRSGWPSRSILFANRRR